MYLPLKFIKQDHVRTPDTGWRTQLPVLCATVSLGRSWKRREGGGRSDLSCLRVSMCGKGSLCTQPKHSPCAHSPGLLCCLQPLYHLVIPTLQSQNLLPSLLPELLAARRLQALLAGVPIPIFPSSDPAIRNTSNFWSDACPWVGWQSSSCSAAKGLGDTDSMEKGSSAELLFAGLLALGLNLSPSICSFK